MNTYRTTSNIKPPIFQDLKSGFWYYNYDIKLENETTQEGEPIYSFILNRIEGKPTIGNCIESVLKKIDREGISLYDYMLTYGSDDIQIQEILENIKVDFNLITKPSELEKTRNLKLKGLEEFDTSDKVNSFTINNNEVWLDKSTRVGLVNSISIEKESGKEQTTIWFNNISITTSCDIALNILKEVELYAAECFNTTANHKLAIQELSTVDEINNYNYTTGYPAKLQFNI